MKSITSKTALSILNKIYSEKKQLFEPIENDLKILEILNKDLNLGYNADGDLVVISVVHSEDISFMKKQFIEKKIN